MNITHAQRFAYTLTCSVFFTSLALVVLNFYALDLFFILLMIEFFVAIELTKPQGFRAYWRKNLKFFVALFVVAFLIIIATRVYHLWELFG